MAAGKKSKDENKEAAQTSWGLKVDWSTFCQVTREADPNDEYGGDDTQSSSTIERVRLMSPGEHPDVVICFEPKAGEEIYLVHARYGTGDSFHHDSGLMHLVGAWRSREMALLACAEIRRGGSHELSLGLFGDDRKIVLLNPPWCGYFETLEEVYADRFEIEPASKPSSRRRYA